MIRIFFTVSIGGELFTPGLILKKIAINPTFTIGFNRFNEGNFLHLLDISLEILMMMIHNYHFLIHE